MESVTITQAERHFSELLRRTEAGEDIIITRQGRHAAQSAGTR